MGNISTELKDEFGYIKLEGSFTGDDSTNLEMEIEPILNETGYFFIELKDVNAESFDALMPAFQGALQIGAFFILIGISDEIKQYVEDSGFGTTFIIRDSYEEAMKMF